MARKLVFGYNPGLPETAICAWGARAIFGPDASQWEVDLLPDRQDMFGAEADREELSAWLNGGALKEARETGTYAGKRGRILTSEGKEIILYEDNTGRIVGNTNGSCGYLYLVGYLFKHVSDAPLPASGGFVIRPMEDMVEVREGHEVPRVSLLVIRKRLEIEAKGVRFKGRSTLAIAKDMLGLPKGTPRRRVMERVDYLIEWA